MPASTTSTVSCPANATNPGAPAAILDACGRTVSPVLIGSTQTPDPVPCEGTIVWTYRYTACDGTTADWTHTYTINYSGGLTPPTSTTATVSCPANATNPGAPANITDACGRTVSPVLIGSTQTPDPVTCEGTIVWTYRYTACDNTTIADWTHTYTIDYSGGLTAPTSTTSTVSCPANATNPGAPANITDACGRTVSPVLIGSSAPVTCEGTIVWTYRYTACDGTTTADWTHTYTINYSGGLTAAPASTTSTVSCPANATNPGAPADILDACGRTVSPVLIGSTQTPDPVTCEGTVVWTYRYTACDGTTADWTHTYTINYSGGLTAVPSSTTSTVSCPANATNPGAPADILDACGRTVSPVLIGSTQTPDPVTCEGTVVWTYRYTACDGTTADWTHTYTIDYSGGLTAVPASTTSTVSCPANATNPGAPADILDACGRTVSPVLIGSTQTPNPVLCEGTIVWTYRYTACDGTTADWTHTYTINYSGGLTPPTSTTATVSCPANATNPGAPANITDACGRTVSPVLIGSTQTPDPVTCEGTIVWTYRYTACDNTTIADWTHTYTIDYSGGLTAPTSTTSTVSCPANATNPGAPANITDACGRTVSPVLIGSSAPVTCEGTIVWTYRYTACDGTTTADWTHTYTINYSGGLTAAPASTTSTVSCPANATNPGAPADILDACGRAVSPVLIGSTQTPDPVTCEGTIVWTYRYTACDGTTADWTHTYTINYSGGLTAVPASTTSTVSCPANATNPGAPANITDACGRTVSPVLIGATQTPDPVTCEGTVVWTYRYTACDGTTADWTHTYTIDYSGGLTAVPASTTSTVSCPANATNPGAPAAILDACGRTVSPVLIGSTQTPNPVLCEGTIVWTYRYTACDGTTADWTHTYTINYSGGLTPPTSTTATVSCPANATNPGAPANITDACGRTVSPVLIGSTQTPDPVTCEGTVVWTYRYTACDGTTTADWTHTYTINYSGGLTPPTSTTATVSCPAAAVNPGAPANITDACGRTVNPVLIGSTQTPDPVTCEGTVVWTYRYTACDGTTADWTHTYTIDYSGGLMAPTSTTATVSCPTAAVNPGAPANITDACGRTVSAQLIGSSAPVTCEGTVVWTYRYTACDGTTTADWTHTYTIERQDFSMPSDNGSTVACIALAVAPAPPAVNDHCGNPITPTGPVQSGTYDGCEGTRIYTYTYTDCELNTHNWVYTYNIERLDFTMPADAGSTVACPTATNTPPTLPLVMDNCGNTLPPSAPVVSAIPDCNGTRTYTYTYTDCEGNNHNWTYTYTVIVTAPPVINCPADITQLSDIGFCHATIAITPATTSSACTVTTVAGVRSDSQPLNAPYPIGITTITWTATDACNQTVSCSQSVTVNNNVVLIAHCQNATVQLDATGNGTLSPSAVDNGNTDACGNLTLSLNQTTFTCADISTNPNTVTLTVTDDNNNTATCSAQVTVQDLIAPVATCQNVTVLLNASGNGTLAASAVNNGSNDACGILSMSLSKTSFNCADISNNPNTVTLTVTDNNNNTGTCSAQVSVLDQVAPTAICQNVTVLLDGSGNGSTTASAVNNGSTDACGIQTMSLSQTAFTCASIGTNPNNVTLTVTDIYNNSSSCNATVTVQDLVPPVAVCQSVTVQLNPGGTVSITPAQINNGSTDLCGIANMTLNNSNFTCANVGTNLVILTVSDMYGNTSTCSASVTVQDLIAPVAVCQSVTINLSNLGTATLTTAAVNNGSSDNCAIVLMSLSQSTFNCTHFGANTVTLMVNDAGGNTSTCSATVNVQDLLPPTALCKAATVQLDGSGNATVTTAQVNNGSADNCGTPALSVNPSTFTCANLGANTVTLTANDGHGNTSSCSSTVTVQDPISPTAVCQNISVTLSSGTASITASQVNNGSSDNCAISSMIVNPSTFTCANAGNNTVTLTVSDASGHTSTCSATVTVTPLISATASSNTPVCTGGTIQLNASGGVSYQWSGPGGFNTTAQNPTRTGATTGMAGTYIVTVTNSAGCAAVVTTSVTVLTSPTTAISGSLNVCTGATLNLSANGGTSYAWNGPNTYSGSGSSISIPNVNGAMAGVYTVTTTSANGCTATASVTVNILAPPTATANGTVNVCIGGNISLSATGGTSYLWNGPNGYSGSGANVTITNATLAKGGTYTVTVTNSSGCTNTASHTVTVNSPPTASASSNSPVCVGTTLTLFGNGGVSYAWSGPSAFTSALQNPTRTPVVAGTYIVTVTSAAGCTATASTSVTTAALPTASVTGATTMCAGGTLTLTASGSGAISYAWSGPNSYTGTGSILSIPNATTAMSGTYVVTVTNTAGCTKTASRTVTVNPAPIATAGSNSPVCLGSTINLTSSGGTSYLWNGPGGYSSTAQNPVRTGATALMAGTYTVTVTGAGGCKSTANTVVVVNSCGAPLVINSYVITQNSSMTLAGNGSILLNVSGGVPCTGGAYYTYAWSPATGVMTSSNGTHTYSNLSQGWYTVTITDCGGNSITQTFYVSNSIRGFKTGDDTFGDLEAYPNPISNEATITFTSYVAEHIRLSVYSVDGKEVGVLFEGQTEENSEYSLKFDMSDLPSATYYALLQAESGASKTIRLIVLR